MAQHDEWLHSFTQRFFRYRNPSIGGVLGALTLAAPVLPSSAIVASPIPKMLLWTSPFKSNSIDDRPDSLPTRRWRTTRLANGAHWMGTPFSG